MLLAREARRSRISRRCRYRARALSRQPEEPMMRARRPRIALAWGIALAAAFPLACTQEAQNKLGRAVQNWTGTNGVLEIYAGDKLVKRFLQIDKLSTAMGTGDSVPRPYRFGYGVLDANLNGAADPGEKKVYFEFSDYAAGYVFYEDPNG
jgi:hypothetical protein